MFTVRAFNSQTGKLEKPRFFADEVTEKTRRHLSGLYNYTCLGCNTAQYHWRKETRRCGNAETLRETFARNRGTQHELGCRYDYSDLARDHSDSVYIKGGALHIRVNFPLGSSYDDLHPPRGDAVPAPAGGQAKIEKRPIDSLRKLVDLLEKKFGGLEDYALQDVKLDYQGHTYRWNDLFIAADDYKRAYRQRNDKDGKERALPMLFVVKPVAEIAQNENGKRRFVCEEQYMGGDYKGKKMRFTVVSGDGETSSHIRRLIERRKHGWNKDETEAGKDTLLVAARPFIGEMRRHDVVNAYLTVMKQDQVARIDTKKYWRLLSGPRHQLSMMDQLSPST